MLWRTNDELLQVGEVTDAHLIESYLFWLCCCFNRLVLQGFYRSERSALGSFLLLPDTLDQWADSMQQRLLGYQEHTRKFLSTSRDGRQRTHTKMYTSEDQESPLSLHPSVFLSTCLPVCSFVCLSTYLFLHLYTLFVCAPSCLSLHLYILYVCLPTCLSTFLSLHLFFSVHRSTYLSLHLSVCQV